MASYSGFLRKAPASRLKAFFDARNVATPEDFDWESSGRGKEFVSAIDDLLGALPDKRQDELKAEIDLLASIADAEGMIAAERICAGQGLDIEVLQGVQDVMLMLAVAHPQIIDRVSAETSLMRRSGGKGWASFQLADDGQPWALHDDDARASFLSDVLEVLNVAAHRRNEADWFRSIRTHPITGEKTEMTQATIYVEDRAESELAFGPSATLERHLVQKVVEVGLACNPHARIVEIAARGGKRIRDQCAVSFAKHFATQSAAPIEVPRREVLIDTLRASPDFIVEPADGISRVEVSSLDFFATGGAFARFEKRGDDETIYQFLDRRFGSMSPLRSGGWTIVAATLRIFLDTRDGKRARTLTVTLRTPNSTTVPNKTEADRQLVFGLLERWQLLAPPPNDDDLFEVVE